MTKTLMMRHRGVIPIIDLQHLYDQFVQLLNQPHDGSEFRLLLTEKGWEPTVVQIGEEFIYEFRDLGISLDTLFGKFFLLTFNLRKSNMQSYVDNFLCGINPKDSREVVQQKLGLKKCRTNNVGADVCDCYDLPNAQICFWFTGKKKRMCLVALSARKMRIET